MTLRMRLVRWFLANALLAGIAFLCAGGRESADREAISGRVWVMDFISILAISPALARERSAPGSEGADPTVRPVASILFVATVAFGALDAGRLHWTFPFPKRSADGGFRRLCCGQCSSNLGDGCE